MNDKYDELIKELTARIWPGLDWKIIKCQVSQESGFNPNAVSSCGARGLLQLMPATAKEMGVALADHLFYPETNLIAGIKYLKIQYDHFPEISSHVGRVKFALAAYNGGRGYINKALKIAKTETLTWENWDSVGAYLKHPLCKVGGKRPDHKQITDYVKRIWGSYLLEYHEGDDQKGKNGKAG